MVRSADGGSKSAASAVAGRLQPMRDGSVEYVTCTASSIWSQKYAFGLKMTIHCCPSPTDDWANWEPSGLPRTDPM